MLAGLSTGCVERYLRVQSDPAGAIVVVDGRSYGAAPVDVPFTYYGTLRLDLWSAERPGVTQYVELDEPWYEHFPIDLFAELLDPFTHVDRHVVTIAVPPAAPAAGDVLERADALRKETR